MRRSHLGAGFASRLKSFLPKADATPIQTVPTPEFPPAKSGWEFYLRHTGRDGTVKQAVLNPLHLIYTKAKYSGRLELSLNAYADEVATFEKYDLVEVWVRNTRLGIMDTTAANGRGFVMDERFIYMEGARNTDDDGLIFWTGSCVSRWAVLSWRRVLWATGQADITQFTGVGVETIGKTLVRLNATADALVSSGRWRDGDLAGMGFAVTIAADQGRGLEIERATNGGQLDLILEDIAAGSGGDFTLTWTGLTSLLLDYSEQQGTDRYDDVIFSLDKRNMARPRSREVVIGAATAAIVAGQGRDEARLIADVEGTDYAADNDIELFVDARDLNTDAGLAARGSQKLAEQASTTDIAFDVIQTSDTFYSPVEVSGRKTYNVGDRVRAEFFGTFDRQITAVTVEWAGEVPTIAVEHGGYVPVSRQDDVIDTLIEKVAAMAKEASTDRAVSLTTNKNKYNAAGDPTADDDVSLGYNKGSVWITATKTLICRSAAAGAAVWDQVN